MSKKQLAILLTIVVALALLALLFYLYSQPGAVTGTTTSGQKLKEFFNATTQIGSGFFSK